MNIYNPSVACGDSSLYTREPRRCRAATEFFDRLKASSFARGGFAVVSKSASFDTLKINAKDPRMVKLK